MTTDFLTDTSVAPTADNADDATLGRLCWYSVPESASTKYHHFLGILLSHGITEASPPAPRGVDVFKRACTDAQFDCVEDGARVRYSVRPTGHDTEKVWRNIIREELDASEHALTYDDLGTVTYHRKTDHVSAHNELKGRGPEIFETIKQYFSEHIDLLTAYAIREFARKNLERNLHAICARPSGGIYFVQKEFLDGLDAIENVVNGVEGAMFHSLPLVDNDKQRAMLRDAFENESVGEIDRLLGEIGEILKGDKDISTKKFMSFRDEYEAIRTKVAEYSDLLDVAMEATSFRLETMSEVLTDLLGRVKVD